MFSFYTIMITQIIFHRISLTSSRQYCQKNEARRNAKIVYKTLTHDFFSLRETMNVTRCVFSFLDNNYKTYHREFPSIKKHKVKKDWMFCSRKFGKIL